MPSLTAAEVRDAGLIIALARRIESRMTELGATAAGLHDKADFLAPKLAPEVLKQLHFIGAVRNRAAHEEAKFTPEEINGYTEACNEVLFALEKLGAEPGGELAPPEPDHASAKTKAHEEKNTAAREASLGLLDLCGLIPEAHIIYLFSALLRGFGRVLDDLCALGFGAFGLFLTVHGARGAVRGEWVLGLILFGLVYCYGVLLAFTQKECRAMHPLLRFAPLLNATVFLRRAAHELPYTELAFALLGLGFTGFGTLLMAQRDWAAGAILYFAGYASSLGLFLVRRSAKKE